MAKTVQKILIGASLAAGAGLWAMAPRTFGNKRKNYVPTLPQIPYAHRGLHDAGSGLSQQYAGESGEYIALQAIQQAYSGVTQAVSSNIRRNKAKIKYNTVVYLINTSSN